jgi:hypothetical protein
MNKFFNRIDRVITCLNDVHSFQSVSVNVSNRSLLDFIIVRLSAVGILHLHHTTYAGTKALS